MRSTSFPCLICGRELLRDTEEYEAQPSDGVMCTSTGNYGSRVYDPVCTGMEIFFNICDKCFVAAGEQGRLFESQAALPMTLDYWGIVGWKRVDRPFVPWHEGMPEVGERYVIDNIFDSRWDDPGCEFKFNIEVTQLRAAEMERLLKEAAQS